MKKVLIFISLFHMLCVFSQAGFYGYYSNISMSVKGSPYFDRVNEVTIAGADTSLTQKRRSWRFSGAIQYEKVVQDRIAVAVGYNFSSLLQSGYFLQNEDRYFATSQRGYYHGADFQFKYFRLGSKAPVGKYIGFSAEYGLGYFKAEEFIGGREFGDVDKGFRKKTWVMEETASMTSDIEFNGAQFFLFNIIIGRSLPLTNRLFLTVESSVKFIQSAKHGNSKRPGWSLLSFDNSFNSEGNNNANFYLFSSSVADYRRFTIDLGLHYNF